MEKVLTYEERLRRNKNVDEAAELEIKAQVAKVANDFEEALALKDKEINGTLEDMKAVKARKTNIQAEIEKLRNGNKYSVSQWTKLENDLTMNIAEGKDLKKKYEALTKLRDKVEAERKLMGVYKEAIDKDALLKDMDSDND